ncbi:hypothetical protein [Chryseobacterium luteum]|uniref:HNH nuclease domain-containing protein n=1 Tax=Chryseobacterium luteum TaxID=421531 RepID=A0A085Z3I3_9FLAO|nr:hypothetical protein [Chryseobacterium luteum]KFE98996.1 hypothetical protein IX38_18300 [Chryseobacterium luteum]
MIYIDKTNQEAIDFVTTFIDFNWLEQNDKTYKYQNIGYPQIKNPVKRFRAFFVDEQNNKCCYCCRDIVNDNSTELEHIIPKTKSILIDFEPYYQHSNVLRQNVVPQSIFELSISKLNKPPFPHHIAYHNIVASCNGKTFESSEDFTCCNRERGDEFVPPFNLMQDAIEYLPDGTIVYMRELQNRTYFEILNLSKEILINIRRLWYLFSISQLTLEQILDEKSIITLEEKINVHAIAHSPTLIEDFKLLETFSNPNIWNIFKEYSYFFDYYRN